MAGRLPGAPAQPAVLAVLSDDFKRPGSECGPTGAGAAAAGGL